MKVSLLAFFLLCWLTAPIRAEEERSNKFQTGILQGVLKEISRRFGVAVIADPALQGAVPREIKGNTVESVLKSLLDPLGFSYNKVDNYYVVSGPRSPLTLLAESESTLVPVGQLDRQMQEKLGELKNYLRYDSSSGVAYVKAPSSQMNRILGKLWELSKTSNELSVVYQLQIIDLGNSPTLDFLFSGKYDSSSDKNVLMLTPEQWESDEKAQIVLKATAIENSYHLTRQPWFIVLLGKTTDMTVGFKFLGSSQNKESYFKVALTPTKVDPAMGKVTSNVLIERDSIIQNKEVASGKQTTAQITGDKVNRVATVVETKPGKREILAMVRQTVAKTDHSQVASIFTSRNKTQEHRDFLFLLTATPICVQSILASSNGLLPVASLGDIGGLDGNGASPERRTRLGIGVAGIGNGNAAFGPWLDLNYPIDRDNDLRLKYRQGSIFSLGFAYNFNPSADLEIIAGKGIGPQGKDAVMFGLADFTKPDQYIEFFGKYYPLAYLFDSREFSWLGVWEAGVRLSEKNYGLSVSAFGDGENYGSRYEIDYSPGDYTWVLGYNTFIQPDYSLGIWLNF